MLGVAMKMSSDPLSLALVFEVALGDDVVPVIVCEAENVISGRPQLTRCPASMIRSATCSPAAWYCTIRRKSSWLVRICSSRSSVAARSARMIPCVST